MAKFREGNRSHLGTPDQVACTRVGRSRQFLILALLFLFGMSVPFVCGPFLFPNIGLYRELVEGRAAGSSADCGPLSLYTISKLAGKGVSLVSLRAATRTSDKGTTLLNLKVAAAALGFVAETRKLSFCHLKNFLMAPDGVAHYAILHTEPGHFVAAIGMVSGKARIVDPVCETREADEFELCRKNGWQGFCLLLSIPEGPN